jgi:uncharacterized lipoprotein YbaY
MKMHTRRWTNATLATILLASVGVVAAAAQEAPQPPVPSTPPVTPNPSQTPTTPRATPSPTVRPARQWKRFDYMCEGSVPLTMYQGSKTVKVNFKDKMYFMHQVPSADGERYSDGKVIWWGRGNGGFLQEDSPDGNGAMMAKDCKMQKGANPDAVDAAGAAKPVTAGGSAAGATPGTASGTMSGTVSGTVSYLVRMALPADAVIDVQVQDVSRADVPASVIAEDQIKLGDRQVPVPFELKIDPARIDPKHTYAVSAKIMVEGQMRFRNDQSYRVLTQGNPSHVEIMVKQVPPSGAAQ